MATEWASTSTEQTQEMLLINPTSFLQSKHNCAFDSIAYSHNCIFVLCPCFNMFRLNALPAYILFITPYEQGD